MAAAIAIQKEVNSILDKGLIVEFESFKNLGEMFEEKSFGRSSELLNIRYDTDNNKTYASVFITEGSLQDFEKKINAYFSRSKQKNGKPKDNQPLIDTIASFRKATVKAVWTDTISMPENEKDIFCWEVWLTARGDRKKQLSGFRELASQINIESSDEYFEFRDRTVLLIRATTKQLEQSLTLLNNIAELRKAKTTADFLIGMKKDEQKEWLDDLIRRTTFQKETNDTPFVCILDTGVNAHPLLANAIDANDLHTINNAWSNADTVGHGTGIAGLALFGDLTEVLESKELQEINHLLESSKIINNSEYYPDDKRPLDLYANYTKQGISQAEVDKPHRKRVFQLAITTIDSRDNGKPSSWSAALDMLAAGTDNNGEKRLFVVAAGNAVIENPKDKYPTYNLLEGIRDPGQSWNALTVGAYTEKDLLSADEAVDNYKPTALHGQISPYTSTSYEWDDGWPLKPDIVMEGGNTAENKFGRAQADSLSLLTTNYKFLEKSFTTMWATSAASALASKMCAQIMKKYPSLAPETIRALMVNSASWTPAMLSHFNGNKPKMNKTDYRELIRICGYGVPNLTRAMTSMYNDFTMIIEDFLTPYKLENGSYKNNEIKFYNIPFPQEELRKLGAVDVEMKVTLSYFIEPNPSSRGRSRHSYQSHGLRFDVKYPSELENAFKGRLTKAMQEDGINYGSDTYEKYWKLGVRGRTKGSIHSDIWTGSAADLAGCGLIAVYPVTGWWKRLKNKETVNNIAHYSLLISIRTSTNTDLMTPVETKIGIMTKTTIKV